MTNKPIKRLNSKSVYKNNWMEVIEDEVEFPNGDKGIYGVVKKDKFAMIVPFDGTYLYLVRQYRYPIQQFCYEFPQGMYENDASLSPEELAKAELKEETGLISHNMKQLAQLYAVPAYANQEFYIFLAQELEQGKQALESSEEGLTVHKVSVEKFEEMITQGEIIDSPTITTYGILKLHKII